jgi:hypothetical protein
MYLFAGGTLQRRWLRRFTTSRKVAGSSPDEVIELFFYLCNPSIRTMASGVYPVSLTEMRTRRYFWE